MGVIGHNWKEEKQPEEIEIPWVRKEGLIEGLIKKRGKGKTRANHTLKTLYKEYREQIGKPASKSTSKLEQRLDIDYKTWMAMNRMYLQSIMTKILEKSEIFSIPCGNGIMYIQKTKLAVGWMNDHNKLKPDYKASKENGFKKIIFHLNMHSNGCRYRFRWEKGKKAPGKWNNGYAFIPCRSNARRLAQLIFSKTVDYFE